MAIAPTGYWDQETANTGHIFSYYLARWIADYLNNYSIVVDLGCGKGTYLQYLNDRGFDHLQGVEGFKLNNFDFNKEFIHIHDLSKPLNLRMTGNVICLEVIEHIPGEFEEVIFDNICRHVEHQGKAIISVAIPGQGGDGHVNCRTNLWAVEKMEARGFKLLTKDTLSARSVVEDYCAYFRETLLIFERV
jgi:2-polyprenyl-3-methyl-5-hydroxy-6-metoxy-1,4-benzoquinol methylase